ncbi:ribonuclease T2 [Flagelloscypha sp. PMI_526]|nr:ribonuclease T2 [Flagelloscypha sp. PMI_526]
MSKPWIASALFRNMVISPLFVAASLLTSAYAHSVPPTYANFSACATIPSFFSCENTEPVVNTCCTPTQGLVLATQFWSTWTGLEREHQLLPKNSWTIHGLWPDNCDGSFEQYCDLSRQYDPKPSPAAFPNGTVIPAWTGPTIDTVIENFGRSDLLDFMNKYWINQKDPNTYLWAHEFSKHATCTSTFDTTCYGGSYKKDQEVIDYFDATIRAYHQYPTYNLLAAFGIVPSNKTTYTLSQFQNAVKSQIGVVPYFGCSTNGTVLTEVWYFSHVYGTEQYGAYKTLDSTSTSSCSSTASIWYYERTPRSEREVRNF